MGGYLSVLEDIVDGTPLLGHAKGLGHYAFGDVGHGNKCMYDASRSAAVLGAGIATGGFGVVVAIGAGVGAGVIYDGITSLITGNLAGYFKDIQNFAEIGDLASARDLLIRLGGDMISAGFGSRQTWEAAAGSTPVVGHVMAMCHYLAKNMEKYRKFVYEATISTILQLTEAFLKYFFY